MAVSITTLGTLRVEQDGRILDRLPAARNRSALLVYLAVERDVTRDAAMGMLWPDRPPARARHLLSQTLYELRQELGEGWVEAVGERLHATDTLRIDAMEMAEAVDKGEYDRASALYQGRFLPGAALAVSRPMEGWIDTQQARLTRLHRRARRGAIEARVARDELREALGLARGWVEADPLDDEAQHRFVELLAATGDRSGALRQYEQYAQLVESELELEPLQETRDLVDRIRGGEVGERKASRVAEPRPEYAAGGTAGGSDVQAAVREAPAPPAAGADSGGSGLDSLLDRVAGLRHRRSVQWTLAYLAGSVVLLEGTEILTDAFTLPPLLLRIMALFLALGAIVVLGAGWYLADRGRRFGKPELALTLLVGTFVLSLPVWFARATPAPGIGNQPPPNRLAVLYFDDLTRDQSLEAMARGFTEELIHELSQVDGLEVLSRRAVAPFRDNPALSYDSLVSTLGAGMLVEGSLNRFRDSIRLTIQLIDGATASPLMSTALQSPADSVDNLLTAMPEEAARLLRRRLGDWVRLRQMETAATSARALELVQRVEPMLADVQAIRQSDLDASLPLLDRADSMMAEAERLDPKWPEPIRMRAEIAKARALATAPIPGHYEPEATRTAFGHLDRLLDKWPGHARALAMRGNMRFGLAESGKEEEEEQIQELYRQAEADLRRAIAEDDALTEGWWGLSNVLANTYAHAEARQAAIRALETDAFLTSDAQNLLHLFGVTFNAEAHSASVHWCSELREHYPATMSAAYCELFLLTSSPLVNPDVDRAWSIARSIVDSSSRGNRDTYRGYTALQVSKVIIRAGMPDSARAVLVRAVPASVPDWAAYDLAHARLLLGEREESLDLLEQWFAFNPVRARRIARDWWFRDLEGHPRFEQMIGRGPG